MESSDSGPANHTFSNAPLSQPIRRRLSKLPGKLQGVPGKLLRPGGSKARLS